MTANNIKLNSDYITPTTMTNKENTPPLTVGTLIANKYRLLALLGKGENGQVWKAEHSTVRTHENEVVPLFALKFIADNAKYEHCEQAEIRQSYKRTIGLKHRNICTFHPLEEDEQHGYVFVMEYVPGETLWKYLNTKSLKKLEFAEVVQILMPIADALDYIHKRELVHRDIRQENIMIAHDGEPQIIDFGLAVQMQNGTASMGMGRGKTGTTLYKAPEQWLGFPLDAKTDQYALGVVAYELLSGALPFEDEEPYFMSLRVPYMPVLPISEISDSVNAVLAKAMAKEGKARFDACRDFIDALTHEVLPS